MKVQDYLKEKRKSLNLSVTAVSLQTSLTKDLILESENQEKELDLAAFFILQDNYEMKTREEELDHLPSYCNWLTSLEQKDQVLLKERTVGIADSFKYRLDSIQSIEKDKIILETGLEIDRNSGSLHYNVPTGAIFNYKIYPKSDEIERCKNLSFLERAVMLYSAYDLL